MPSDAETLLRVRDLRTHFDTEDGLVRAVDGVSFQVPPRRTFALVGESGCGKSVTAYSVLRLLAMPPARIASGSIRLEGRELLNLSEKQMRNVRGRQISMIFQEPMSSLNPVFTCGTQIVEAIRMHRSVGYAEAKRRAIEMLEKVGIPEPAQRYREYPHQLSGGMRQRVMIAMAMSCEPKLLIADEPTTALDVTIQAQILDLLGEVQRQAGLSIMLITHDLAVVAETADAVAVMYAGNIVEQAPAGTLFDDPLHPYTRGLLRSVPKLGERQDRLATIPGAVPDAADFPTGCRFHPRCPLTRRAAERADGRQLTTIRAPDGAAVALTRCVTDPPPLKEVAGAHWVACWECPGYEQAGRTDPSDPMRWPEDADDTAE